MIDDLSKRAEAWLLASAHGTIDSEARGYVDALGEDHASLTALLRAVREEGERDAFAATVAFLRAGQRTYEAEQAEATDWRGDALRDVRVGR